MKNTAKIVLSIGVAALAGCGVPQGSIGPRLATGDLVPVNALLESYGGQIACSGYDAPSDSCKSIASWTVAGDQVVIRETGFAEAPGGTVQKLELISVGRIVDDAICVASQNIGLGQNQLEEPAAEFILAATRGAVASRGGVCTRYFGSPRGEGLVARTLGANGRAMPTGDVPVMFFPFPKELRVE